MEGQIPPNIKYQMKLSIIIPVYNGAATIDRCLDSIYSQGLNKIFFEETCTTVTYVKCTED